MAMISLLGRKGEVSIGCRRIVEEARELEEEEEEDKAGLDP